MVQKWPNFLLFQSIFPRISGMPQLILVICIFMFCNLKQTWCDDKTCIQGCPIVNPDMFLKYGKRQSFYNELWFYVNLASPCTNLLKFCPLIFHWCGSVLQRGNTIGGLLHYTKNSLSSLCTSQHKHKQKDRTKMSGESPEHNCRFSLVVLTTCCSTDTALCRAFLWFDLFSYFVEIHFKIGNQLKIG